MNKNIVSLSQAQSLGCIPPCVATMVSLVSFISFLGLHLVFLTLLDQLLLLVAAA